MRFEDASGDPKTLTVNRAKGTDGLTYLELELVVRDDDGNEDCYHSFWMSDRDAEYLGQMIQAVFHTI